VQQVTDFYGKRIVILGLARQGLALARFFVRQGAQVMISDAAPAQKVQSELTALGELPVELALGGHPLELLDRCDLLCLSGGVPPQLEFVQAAVTRRIPLSNDSLLTFQLARRLGLGPIIAITGSSGKTTTTTLVGRMLAESGRRVHVGGNIGTPLIDRLHTIEPGDCIVLELSSFQLELFDSTLSWGDFTHIGPDVAAILNITPNHLDRHPSMSAYAAAKFNLLRNLPANATVVLNADDLVTASVAGDAVPGVAKVAPAAWVLDAAIADAQAAIRDPQAAIVCFSREQPLANGAWIDGDLLLYDGKVICRLDEVQLRGEHNLSNLLAAAAISGAVGADVRALGRVAQQFTGVPHRLEVVSEVDGVLWVNDSIATSPERVVAALRSFSRAAQTLILLAGGKDKNLPWTLFADEAIQRVTFLIGFGQAGAMIVNTVQERAAYTRKPAPNCAVVQRLDEAVELAARVAQRNGCRPIAPLEPPHTVILLSPGGTSYDAYKDFEARGAHFAQLVTKWVQHQEAVIA
jgi:UDP-N-acetylmuramoylalanine--D-glutamate ligase